MALFDVPGWSVQADTVEDVSSGSSKKRKRPASDTGSDNRMHSAEVNIEKLMKKLTGKTSRNKGGPKVSKSGSPGPQKTKKRKDQKPKKNDEELKNSISLPMPLKALDKSSASTSRPTKKAKTKHESRTSQEAPAPIEEPDPSSSAGLTSMQKSMKQSLDGARFRLINEKLYKSDSGEAHRMMQDEPVVYSEYHNGFRHQVQSWPTNPVDHYVSTFSKYAPKTVIADLGCGDAAIARALVPKGMIVLSYDLVSNDAFVVEADICGKLPLPGSEDADGKSKGQGHIVDVVVFSLSLMSTNWPQSIREAWRILKPDGELKIAEVASRFSKVEDFTSLVASCGFRLKSKDDRNTHFTLFEFKKVQRDIKTNEQWAEILAKGSILKPCEYKRRCTSLPGFA